MSETLELTVEHLKTLGTPNYFGLGFIQLKINERERLHFYHPEVMPILDEEEIHDHRYDFESTILKGNLYNQIYSWNDLMFAEYGLFEVSCKREDAGKDPYLIREGEPDFVCSFSSTTGQTYELSNDMFHRIKYHSPTITYLKRGPLVSEYARIIKKLDAPSVCPFSKVMEQEEIWETIQAIIDA